MFSNLSNKAKLMTLAGFVIALIAVPLTIIQVQKQQSIRQHAASGDSVSFNLIPQAAKIKAGESFSSDVHLLNNSEKDISSIDVIMQYDSSILGAGFQPNHAAGYTTIINEAKNNTIHYVAVNSSPNPITGTDLPLGTLILTGKADGTGKVSLENVQVTASGNSEKLAVDASIGTLERQYVIGDIDSSPTISPTPTPTPDASQLNSQCLKLCEQGALVSGTFDKSACIQNCDSKYRQRELSVAPAGNKPDLVITSITYEAPVSNSDSTIAAIDTIVAALESGTQTENDTYTGFGIVNWFNMIQLTKTGIKLKDLDDQVTLYTTIKNDLSSGKTMEEVLNIYRSFLDNSGQINKTGQDFFQKTYGDPYRPGTLMQKYNQECTASIFQKIAENKENQNRPETYTCQTREKYVRGQILDFRLKEEMIIKNSINPLTLALEKYDKAVRNGENVDDLTAEIYYQTAKLLEAKANDDLAIEFYTLVSTNFITSPRINEVGDRVIYLNSTGHKAWMFGSVMLVSVFGADNLIPFNPCKGPVKIACKFVSGKSSAILKAVFRSSKALTAEGEKQLTGDLIKAGVVKSKAADVALLVKKIAQGITPSEEDLNAARKAIQEASEVTAKTGTNIPKRAPKLLDQNDLKNEVQRIAGIKNEANYKNQFLSDIEKQGGKTIKAAQKVLSARVLRYVDDYAEKGFLSIENAKIFRQTADKMAKDMAEEYVNESGFLFWKSIDTSKLMKIDKLMHKTVASVSYLEHVASGQRFSNHSFRHLYEDLFKVTNAISGSSSFTKSDKIYLTFTSLLHDIGYTAEDIVQRPLNFFETSQHPEQAYRFVLTELQRDFKEVLGGKSALIVENTLRLDIEEAVGKEGAATIMDAIRKHGDKTFKYTPNNLKGNNRVAAVFALADDLAADKVPDLYRYPEIAKIVTDFFQASSKRLDIAGEVTQYIKKLENFVKIKDSDPDGAAKIYEELMDMDHGSTTVLGRFRTEYRQKMLAALEKYRPSIPDARFQQYMQAIETITESEFPFTVATAIVEKTSFSVGQNGAHIVIEISEPLFNQLSDVVGESQAKGQITKILESLVARSSNQTLSKEEIKATAEKIFINRGGQLGSGNDVEILFTQAQRGADVLRDIRP